MPTPHIFFFFVLFEQAGCPVPAGSFFFSRPFFFPLMTAVARFASTRDVLFSSIFFSGARRQVPHHGPTQKPPVIRQNVVFLLDGPPPPHISG